MKQVAEFEIRECYNITIVGLVIAGEITSGEIKRGDHIIFRYDKDHTLEISDVNYVDKRISGITLVGLNFVYESIAEKDFFRDLKISQQVAVIVNKE